MIQTLGSALETEIAYRRERMYDAASAGSWKRPRGRRTRSSRIAATGPQHGGQA